MNQNSACSRRAVSAEDSAFLVFVLLLVSSLQPLSPLAHPDQVGPVLDQSGFGVSPCWSLVDGPSPPGAPLPLDFQPRTPSWCGVAPFIPASPGAQVWPVRLITFGLVGAG